MLINALKVLNFFLGDEMIDFDSMVDNYLKREQRAKQVGRYYPSEIGSCIRKIWYSYKHPLPVKAELMKIFEMGNILHDFVVEVLKSEKNPAVELLKSEFPFKIEKEDFLISGRVDDLILVKESGKNVLVEVKSTKSIDFVDKPSLSHEIQLQFYMHATGVHNGVVLYIDKSNLKSKVFSIEYDKKRAEEILQRFATLHRKLKSGELPEAEAKQLEELNWVCRFCEYREKCEKNEK